MENLHGELSVLSKSIHYKNLSAAAEHVGLSQPQLSRIILKLEGELGLVLLDRTVRRKSGWTPVAYKIADAYLGSERKLTQSLLQFKSDDQVTRLSVGLLEGLIPLAAEFCKQAFQLPKLMMIELNVYDLSELEERFEKDELDLIFTCREPGKHKYSYVKNLGYQFIAPSQNVDAKIQAFSPFEHANHIHQLAPNREASKGHKTLISNSLAIRRLWIEDFKAFGLVPSAVRPKKSSDQDTPVYLIAQDLLIPSIWDKFSKIQL